VLSTPCAPTCSNFATVPGPRRRQSEPTTRETRRPRTIIRAGFPLVRVSIGHPRRKGSDLWNHLQRMVRLSAICATSANYHFLGGGVLVIWLPFGIRCLPWLGIGPVSTALHGPRGFPASQNPYRPQCVYGAPRSTIANSHASSRLLRCNRYACWSWIFSSVTRRRGWRGRIPGFDNEEAWPGALHR
jgi:hypothetical protein